MRTPFQSTPRALFRDSAAEFKHLPSLTIAALLLALKIAISSFGVYITPDSRVTFGFLTTALTGLLFGPIMAMVTAGLGDIIGYLLHPVGAYFPGFLLTAMADGLIYGVFLYHRPVKLPRIIFAKVLVTFICNLGMNMVWKTIFYGQGFWALFPVSFVKNMILLPIEILMMFALCKAIPAIYHQVTGKRLAGA